MQSPVLRERLVSLCPFIYQQPMSQILLNDLTLLTIMSSDKLMNVSKVGEFLIIFLLLKMLSIAEDLCKQQMRLLLIDIGPWVRVTPTLHELYAHLPQLIEENGGRGLKALSEENLEEGRGSPG